MKNGCGPFLNGRGISGEKGTCMLEQEDGGRDGWWLWRMHRGFQRDIF